MFFRDYDCFQPMSLPMPSGMISIDQGDRFCLNLQIDQGDGSNDHLIDTRPAFPSALSWHIIQHWLSSAKITIPFHFTKAFAEK